MAAEPSSGGGGNQCKPKNRSLASTAFMRAFSISDWVRHNSDRTRTSSRRHRTSAEKERKVSMSMESGESMRNSIVLLWPGAKMRPSRYGLPIKNAPAKGRIFIGGEGGIRTRDRVAPVPPFQGGDLNRSSTSPGFVLRVLRAEGARPADEGPEDKPDRARRANPSGIQAPVTSRL
jgi:hypothetical protein